MAMIMDDQIRNLVRDAKRGDADAYGQLIDEYGTGLLHFAASLMPTQEDATDVVQDTLIQAWSSLGRLRKEESFPAWLRTICRNRIRNYYRKKSREPSFSPLNEAMLESMLSATPSDEVSLAEWGNGIEACIAGLRPRYEDMIRLRYQDELSVLQIAALRGTTPKAVSHALGRSLDALLICLRSKKTLEGGDEHPVGYSP